MGMRLRGSTSFGFSPVDVLRPIEGLDVDAEGVLAHGVNRLGWRDDDGEEAREPLGVFKRAALEDALEPPHLERGVRRPHYARYFDGHGLAPYLGEGVVVPRIFVERDSGTVGDEVVALEPVRAHTHGINRQGAHVVDEARQMKGYLRIARFVDPGGWPHNAGPASRIDFDNVGRGRSRAPHPQ